MIFETPVGLLGQSSSSTAVQILVIVGEVVGHLLIGEDLDEDGGEDIDF